MKISIDPAAVSYANTVQSGTKMKKSVPQQDTRNNFDQIMIQSNSREKAESQMARSVEQTLARAVYKPVPEEKITQLKELVSQGLYSVDADAVASRILLMKGE